MFQVSQVGDDAHAVRFLNQLRNDRNLARMVYCTSGISAVVTVMTLNTCDVLTVAIGKLDVRMEKLKNNERDLERWVRIRNRPYGWIIVYSANDMKLLDLLLQGVHRPGEV